MEPIDLEEMILSDKKDIVCKLETVLSLENSHFPYPPFSSYEVILSDTENIRMERVYDYVATGEGGRSTYREVITFKKPGQYKIKIKDKNETGYKFYFIDVIVV